MKWRAPPPLLAKHKMQPYRSKTATKKKSFSCTFGRCVILVLILSWLLISVLTCTLHCNWSCYYYYVLCKEKFDIDFNIMHEFFLIAIRRWWWWWERGEKLRRKCVGFLLNVLPSRNRSCMYSVILILFQCRPENLRNKRVKITLWWATNNRQKKRLCYFSGIPNF